MCANNVHGKENKIHTTNVAAPLKLSLHCSLIALIGRLRLLLTSTREIYNAVPDNMPPDTIAVNFRHSFVLSISILQYIFFSHDAHTT